MSKCAEPALLLVGVSYDKGNPEKPHSCVIERGGEGSLYAVSYKGSAALELKIHSLTRFYAAENLRCAFLTE